MPLKVLEEHDTMFSLSFVPCSLMLEAVVDCVGTREVLPLLVCFIYSMYERYAITSTSMPVNT